MTYYRRTILRHSDASQSMKIWRTLRSFCLAKASQKPHLQLLSCCNQRDYVLCSFKYVIAITPLSFFMSSLFLSVSSLIIAIPLHFLFPQLQNASLCPVSGNSYPQELSLIFQWHICLFRICPVLLL